jgi:hypothetical protein
VTYLHHDQSGSTRLLTNSSGNVEGAYTYTPYGGVAEHTGSATTALGYDGQYTNLEWRHFRGQSRALVADRS